MKFEGGVHFPIPGVGGGGFAVLGPEFCFEGVYIRAADLFVLEGGGENFGPPVFVSGAKFFCDFGMGGDEVVGFGGIGGEVVEFDVVDEFEASVSNGDTIVFGGGGVASFPAADMGEEKAIGPEGGEFGVDECVIGVRVGTGGEI